MANPLPRAVALMSARGLTGGDHLLLPGCIAAGRNQPRHDARHDRPNQAEFIGLTALSLPARGKGQDVFTLTIHAQQHGGERWSRVTNQWTGATK